jgi:hypothetical protein
MPSALHAYAALGIDEISIHNVASNQRAFIDAFGPSRAAATATGVTQF